MLPLAEELKALLPVSVKNLRALVSSLRDIAQEAARLADETEFGFLVDANRQILSIGFDLANEEDARSLL